MKSEEESEGATIAEGEPCQEGRAFNPEEAYWGICPACHRNDGYLNVGRDHWFVCHAHRVKWCIGSNLFSSWRYESREEWAENRDVLKGYTEIEPEFPAEAGECEPDTSE